MENQAVGLSVVYPDEGSVDQATLDASSLKERVYSHGKVENSKKNTPFCASSGQSSNSENMGSSGSLKAPRSSEDAQMPEIICTSKIKLQDPELALLDCQGDEGSCISKESGAALMSGDHIGDADHKDGTSSKASVCGFFSAGLEKSVNYRADKNEFSGDQISAEEGKKCLTRARKYSNDAVLATVEFPDRSDPSETSFFRDEAVPYECGLEQAESLPAKMTDSNILVHKLNEKSCLEPVKPETDFVNGNPSVDSLNCSDGNDHLKCNAPLPNTQEVPLQSQTLMADDGSDELVDVRVCDICGDAGREALLAICSKCSDGAEHIYCMRIKMDKVPEGTWMCEECTAMQAPKRPRQAEVDRSASVSNPSRLTETGQDLPTVKSGIRNLGERRVNNSSKVPCLSRKRPRHDVEVRHAPKKRTVEKSVQSLNSSAIGGKSSCQRSRLPEQQFCGGALPKSESVKISDSNGEVPVCGDIHPERTAKGSIDSKIKKGNPDKKLLKSLSFSGICSVPPNVSNAHFSHASNAKHQRHGRGRSSTEEKESIEKNRSQLGFRYAGSVVTKNDKVGTNEVPKVVKAPHFSRNEVQDGQVGGNSSVKKEHPDKKLLKSMSFSGVGSGLPAVPHALNLKRQRCGSGRNLSEKYDLIEKDRTQLAFPFAVSVVTNNKTVETKVVQEVVKAPLSSRNSVQDAKCVQIGGNSNVKALGSVSSEGRNYMHISARPDGENLSPPARSRYGVSSAKNTNSCPEHKASQFSQKANPGRSSRDDNGHLIAPNKVLPIDLNPVKDVPIVAPADVLRPETSAVPKSKCIWKGGFIMEKGGKLPNECSGIQAHLSTCASSKVLELVLKFRHQILLKEVPRLDAWPVQFQKNHPTEQDIALYFFAEDLQSYARSYNMLVQGMIENDLALAADFDGVQLLIFPSNLLPLRSQRWNSLSFLWGVFRVRKVGSSLHILPLVDVTLNQGLCAPATCCPPNNSPSAPVAGSFYASHASHNSTQRPVSVPMVLHSSTSTKSMDQSCEHEVSSVEKYLGSRGARDLFCPKDDTLPSASCPIKEELHSNDFQKGNTNTDIVLGGQSRREYTLDIGFSSDRNNKGPTSTKMYDSASKLRQEGKRRGMTGRNSFSIDSGPSGSSDGGGYSKSDEGQVDQQSENAPNYKRAVNLDLCLGTWSEPQGEVELDLVLGFPRTSKYQAKHCTKYSNGDGGNVSLALSLGLPCSNG